MHQVQVVESHGLNPICLFFPYESPEVPTKIPLPPTCTLFSEEIPTEIFDLFEKIVQSEASNEIQNADPSK
jgi:hypothetical protein